MTKSFIKLANIGIPILYIFYWASISTSPHDLENLKFKNFYSLVNALRISLPLLFSVLIPLLIVHIIYIKKFKFTYNISLTKIFFISLISYFSLQYVGLYFNKLINFELHYFFLINLAFGSLTTLLLTTLLNPKNLICKRLMIVSVFILSIVSIFLLIKLFQNYSISNHIYLYNSVSLDDKFFEQTFPRVTGIARSLSLLAVLLLLSIFFIKKNKTILSIEYLIFFSLAFIIWGIQSRGAILCFLFSSIFLIFFIKSNIQVKLFRVLVFIILPIFVFEIYKYHLIDKTIKINFSETIIEEKKELNVEDKKEYKQELKTKLANNRFNYEQGSSGRVKLWKKSLEKYDKKKLFGYGPQADRLLISDDLTQQYGNNVSNGFIYAFLCSGYFGLLLFVIFNLLIYFSLLIAVFKIKIFEKKNLFKEKLSTIYLIFFSLRICFENSYSVFSIDFLITIISLYILINYLDKKKLILKNLLNFS